MKRLFGAISVLAIAHLLGVIGAVAWLAGTQRLDGARVEAIRQLLHEPVPVVAARLEAEQKAAADQEAARPEALPERPPVPSEELVQFRRDLQASDEFRVQRLERETQDLARTTTLELQRLDRERTAFEKERAEFERMRAQIAAVEGDVQFKAALSVLKEVKPADAKAMLQQIIEGVSGPLSAGAQGATGMERAVAYLDALGSMERGEIMSQFVKDSPDVAAELLERIRTFGLVADASGGPAP